MIVEVKLLIAATVNQDGLNEYQVEFLKKLELLTAALAVVDGVQKQMGNIDIPIDSLTPESILEEVKEKLGL